MDKKDTLAFLWNEFELRQQHYWKTFDRLGLAIVAIDIVPYAKPEILRELGNLALAFPVASFGLSVVSSWLLGAEYQRLRMVKEKYDQIFGEDIPRMPCRTWWERRFATRLGVAIARLFALGLGSFSLLSAFVLWAYLI